MADSTSEVTDKLLSAVQDMKRNPHCEVEISLQGSLIYSDLSISEKIAQWTNILESYGINVGKVRWNADKVNQISSKIIYSSFSKLLVDRIADNTPQELNELSAFLFERLQQNNPEIL